MRVKTLVIFVLIIPAILLAGLYARELYLVDLCIDHGGSFDYTSMTCDPASSHPYIPFLARHTGFSIFVAVSACLAVFAAWLGRTKSSAGKRKFGG